MSQHKVNIKKPNLRCPNSVILKIKLDRKFDESSGNYRIHEVFLEMENDQSVEWRDFIDTSFSCTTHDFLKLHVGSDPDSPFQTPNLHFFVEVVPGFL